MEEYSGPREGRKTKVMNNLNKSAAEGGAGASCEAESCCGTEERSTWGARRPPAISTARAPPSTSRPLPTQERRHAGTPPPFLLLPHGARRRSAISATRAEPISVSPSQTGFMSASGARMRGRRHLTLSLACPPLWRAFPSPPQPRAAPSSSSALREETGPGGERPAAAGEPREPEGKKKGRQGQAGRCGGRAVPPVIKGRRRRGKEERAERSRLQRQPDTGRRAAARPAPPPSSFSWTLSSGCRRFSSLLALSLSYPK